MKAIRLTLVVGAVLLSANPAFPHFVKAALGFRLGYSPAEKGYGEKLTLNSGAKKGVGVQLLSGVNNGGWQSQGEASAASSNTVTDTKAAGSAYGVGIAPVPASQAVGQGRSLGGGGPLEALGGAHGAVRHLRILGLNLYLGGRAAALGQGLGINQKQQPVAKKPLLGGIFGLGGGQPPQGNGNLVTGPSPLGVLTKPVTVGAGVGAKSNLLTNLGPAPNGGKNIGGLHGIRIAAGTPGFGLGMNLGLRHGINSKSPLGLAFGLGGAGGPPPSKYAIGKIPFVYSGGKGQDQAYIPGSGILRGHGHDNNLAFSPNNIQGLESKPQIILAQAPLQLSVIPLQGAAAQVIPQAQPSQQHHQQASAPQQHQGLQGPLSIPSTYRNPFLSFLRPSILRPSPLQYTFNHPQAQQTGPIRLTHSHHNPHHHPRHPQVPQRPRQAHPHETPSLFSGWSTLFPLGRHKHASTNANNYFVNPLLPNGQPLAKLQASLRPGHSASLTSAQRQVPFIQQAQRQQHHPQQQQQQYRGFHPQYTSGFQNALGVQPQQQNNFQQQYFNPGALQQRPGPQASPINAPSHATQQHNDYNFFGFQNFQTPFQIPQQASPFLTGNVIQPSQTAASPITGTQFNQDTSNFPSSSTPFTTDSTQFAPPPGFQYSHSTHSQPVKMGSFTMDIDLGARNSGEQGSNSNDAPLYGPLGRRLKKTKSSKSKTRTDVIIKKKDDFTPYNPFQDMETSASTNALNTINQMTLTSSLGETSWTPIIHVEIPSLARKSFETSPIVSPRPSLAPIIKSEKKVKSLPLSKESTLPLPKEAPKSSSPAPSSPTTSAITSQDRSMIFRRRKLNLSGEQISTSSSSSTSAATSPSTVVQLPLVSPSTISITRTSAPSASTTVRPPPSTVGSSSSSSPSISSSLAPSTSSQRPSTTTTVSSLPSSASTQAASSSSSQTSPPVTTDPSV